jgi:hypothetical protein
MNCSQCGTEVVTCTRCRKKHCYHHYCPETESDGKTKNYNQPPKEIWSEEHNQKEISKTDEAWNKARGSRK